ncbi:hypothetical protein LR013_03690 [candidate division NPL-UPA2 bacterium]|nr:hypothetical protein [candidate division NPL-UPA2 bacterium]
MKYADIVSFRKDLLFNGAVQINWFENDKSQAEKAAEHFIFHGPDYHGVVEEDFDDSSHKLLDTAKFTLDILERITGRVADEPFAVAVAGYGTGKSHLGVTLASLLSELKSNIANKIVANIAMADTDIGGQVHKILETTGQPFLVAAINGMQDFDLSNEIIRQILLALNQKGLDTTVLENLRPRFRTAINFTTSFFAALKGDFQKHFGNLGTLPEIITCLQTQDEETFRKISKIYEQKMGTPIHAAGQESLHDFIRITKETYCGQNKPFAGILIIFDEFGRYLEFSVQKPHVAGSGALQQLFESVQANSDGVFLLCFIQYELKAYISRIAPERREDLNRYVTRYDAVRKVRLSTNLETLIANLFEKKKPEELERQVLANEESSDATQLLMKRWFPDMKNQAIWKNNNRFEQIIYKGCWPLHPLSTWILYKLSSVGKSFQQRSALSLFADVYTTFQDTEVVSGKVIRPVDLCNEAMIDEFLASEQYGQQGAAAHAYKSVLYKYQHELSIDEKAILKAVLVAAKIGIKVESKEEFLRVLIMFSGIEARIVTAVIHSLEYEYAVLEWNGQLCQYSIAEDAIPRKTFLAHLEAQVVNIDSQRRTEIFSQNYANWAQKDKYNTDFGSQNQITTKEWNYNINFSNIFMLEGQIDFALSTWRDARGVDAEKGQLIYCYVGPESNLGTISEKITEIMRIKAKKNNLDLKTGAPVAVLLLSDAKGYFGQKIAEYWVLQEQMGEEESQKYANFILDRKNSVEKEMFNLFSEMEKERNFIFATEKKVGEARIKNMLTQLFDVIYFKRIPFPFDGFHTARGNAAKDCQLFTRQLFLGELDKEWISACNQQQRNRAYQVLDESWGVFDEDGSIRIRPKGKAVCELIEFMEAQLESEEGSDSQKPVNIGEVMRLLCAPPYGCNLASGGMLLALFLGRRNKRLNLLKNKQPISVESWLQTAISGNFLDMSTLDVTDIVQISKEKLSEWESLLEEWSIEKTLLGKVSFQRKASELNDRISVPQTLYYRYQHLDEKAKAARRKLGAHEQMINEAYERIEKGIERNNASLLSWGGAELADIYNMMDEQWTQEQVREIEEYLAEARLQTQQCFPQWLRHKTIAGIEHLSKFKHIMLSNIKSNLTKLNLMDEIRLLEGHVKRIEENIHFITKIKRTVSDIENMIRNNKITEITPVLALNDWLQQVQEFIKRLDEARERPDITQDEVVLATNKLATFQQACRNHLESFKERTTKVYNIETISSLSDIDYWQNEITSLITIYKGLEKDVEDLKLIQKQFDLIGSHFQKLNNENLNDKELGIVCKECVQETEEEFYDDVPPLDNELIYDSIIKIIRGKRGKTALGWMQRNVPDLQVIVGFNALEATERRAILREMPRVLSDGQSSIVKGALEACEKRLDELEIEGLLERFRVLSERNKRAFLEKVSNYISGEVL